jgi:hypothetical protein
MNCPARKTIQFQGAEYALRCERPGKHDGYHQAHYAAVEGRQRPHQWFQTPLDTRQQQDQKGAA